MDIRAATLGDEPVLRRALFLAWQWRDDRPAERGWVEYLAEARSEPLVDGFGSRSGDVGVIAQVDGRPVGAAWARLPLATTQLGRVADDVPVLALALEPDARGGGLGSRLLEAVLEAAVSAGHRAVSLHVSEENSRATELYRRAGFTEVAVPVPSGAILVRDLG